MAIIRPNSDIITEWNVLPGIVTSNQPWRQQPQIPVEIDSNNPIGKQVVYASTVANVVDVKTQTLGTLINNPPTVPTTKGQGRSFTASSSQAIHLPTSNLTSGFPITVSFFVKGGDASAGCVWYTLCGTNYKAVCGPLNNTTFIINSTSAPGYQGISLTSPFNDYKHFVVIHRSGSFDIYINGVKQTQYNSGSNWGEPAAGNHAIGYRKNGASLRYTNGVIQDFTVFSGELSQGQIFSLFNNPYQIFRPQKRISYFLPPQYSQLNETAADNADYISAPSAGLITRVGLDATTDPGVNTGHVLRYRAASDGDRGVIARVVETGSFPFIVPSRKVWTQQPQLSVMPNTGIGVLSATSFASHNWSVVNTSVKANSGGMCVVGNGTNAYAKRSIQQSRNPPLFIVVHGRRTATATSGNVFYALGYPASLGSFLGFRVNTGAQGTSLFYRTEDGGNYYEVGTSLNVTPLGTDFCAVGVVNGFSPSDAYIYINGIKYNSVVTSNTLVTSSLNYTIETVCALTRTATELFTPYSIYSCGYGRGISENTAMDISANPWQIFRPRRQITYVDLGRKVIAERTPSLTTSPADYTIDLTTGEAAAITDYSALAIEVEST